jgi:malonate transporter
VNLPLLLSAIAPVILVLALGFAAGKHHSFDSDQAHGLSKLALQYALPAALFLGMAHFDRALLLKQGLIIIVMVVGYSAFFVAAYAILRACHLDKLKATLLGYTVGSTAVPIYGLTVLGPIYGQQVATGIVGLAALVTNLTQVSVAIYLLESASAKPGATVSVSSTLGHAVINPLVWCPVLGAAFALTGWNLTPFVSLALAPLSVSAAGVAIFASGVALAAYPIKILSRTVLLGSLVCIVIQPTVFFLTVKLCGLTGAMANAVFVSSTMPTSTPSVLFAQQYGSLEAETASIMLVTTVAMIGAIPVSMALCAYL